MEDVKRNFSSPRGGNKSADKMVSPGRVRTMKEYEEQMAELKKENFNLKLRIYFIEERQEQMKGLKDVDELFKKNVELSCELETLKKDLSEKEDLLVQSAKAMEILQSQHKKQIEELKQTSARDKAYLEDHISNLQKILREKEQTINQFDDSSAMYAMAFGYNKPVDPAKEVDDLKFELNNVTLKVVQLEELLQEERQRYVALESELEQAHEESARLKNQIASLETEVEKRDARLQQAYLDLDRKTEQLHALTQRASKKEKTKADQLAEKDAKVSELEAKIGELERRLQAGGANSVSGGRKSSGDVSNTSKDGGVRQRLRRGEEKGLAKQLQDAHSKLIHLEEQAQTMQTRLHEAQLTCDNKDSDISRLQDEYHKACVTIQALLKKNKLRDKEIQLLKSEIEKKSFPSSDNCENSDKSNEALRRQLDLAEQKIAELVQERSAVTTEMESQIQNLKKSLQEKDTRLKELEEKINSVSVSECKDNRTAELESKLEEMKIKLQSIQHENKYDVLEGGKSNSLKDDKLLLEFETKKKEVEYLKSELKKRTFNLQELVNKELWDKNREIEKLNKLCERRQMEIIQLKQQLSSNDAQVSFAHDKLKESGNLNSLMREVQIMNFEEIKENCNPLVFGNDDKKALQDQLLHCWEEKKFLVQKVEELEERLQNMPERDSDSRLIQTLKSDLTRARQDVEAAEKSRKEVVTACSLLTNRLQELADFLDSLLPSLGAKKRRVVQHAVERSRELSRSFSAAADDNNSWQNLQPSLYVSLLPDFSTVDFWSGDDITDLTLEEEANDEVETISQLRSKVESLEKELKEKDTELNKLHSQYTPTFQSMWSLGTNEIESLGAESNNLAKLVSMFESLDANENIDNILEDRNNEGGILDSFISGKNNVLLRNELKSSNIGEIVITSKKVSSKDDKSGHNIGSESEAWSEPDRSVSLARIGLTDDTATQSWVHDDSSDTTDNGQKNSLGGKRIKYDTSELRRLQSKVRSLEEANEALRGELSILHKLAPPGLNTMEDKSTSIEGFTEAMPVPPNVLDEIRNQREKLESAIYYNDNIRRQLEAIFISLKVQDRDSSLVQISKDDFTKMTARCIELENQCKALESQCNDLEVALHTEQSGCNEKEELIRLEKEYTVVKEEQEMWKEKAESLQSEVDHLENELRLKCKEVAEKESSLYECRSDAQKQSDELERKVKAVETQLKEERDRWLDMETEIQSRLKVLESECDDLKLKLKKCDDEKREITSQLELFKLEDDKCKKHINDLTNRLEECKTKEEKLLVVVEEWKLKWLNCQKDAEEAKKRLYSAEQKMFEMEKINSELEMGLRGQVEAASRQCSQAEFKIKDLEMKQKQQEAEWRTRALEAEREQNERVAEWRRQLDAATLTTSEMVLERTRLANDKLRLQQEIRRRDVRPNKKQLNLGFFHYSMHS